MAVKTSSKLQASKPQYPKQGKRDKLRVTGKCKRIYAAASGKHYGC
jgi:hypothetical protein